MLQPDMWEAMFWRNILPKSSVVVTVVVCQASANVSEDHTKSIFTDTLIRQSPKMTMTTTTFNFTLSLRMQLVHLFSYIVLCQYQPSLYSVIIMIFSFPILYTAYMFDDLTMLKVSQDMLYTFSHQIYHKSHLSSVLLLYDSQDPPHYIVST